MLRSLAVISLCLGLMSCAATKKTVGETKLEIASITPNASSELTEDSVIEANLTYEIENFKIGQYFIIAQFATSSPGATTDGTFPAKLYPVLSSRKGSATIRFPIKHVWNDGKVIQPFVMTFNLNKVTGYTTSHIVSRSDKIEFMIKK